MDATAWFLIAAGGVIVAQALAARKLVRDRATDDQTPQVSITNQYYQYGDTHHHGEGD